MTVTCLPAKLKPQLWLVADIGDEICVSLSDMLYSFIIVDYYNCLSYKHVHVSYMSPRYVFPCIVSSFDLEFWSTDFVFQNVLVFMKDIVLV